MTELEQLLEVKSYEKEGYKPLIYHGDWMMAILNYCPGVDKATRKEEFEKHLNTDEAFALLNGKAILIVASGIDKVEKIHLVPMKKGGFYNVRQGVWHSIAMSKDAKVAIIENRDTDLKDVIHYSLTEEQIKKVSTEIKRIW